MIAFKHLAVIIAGLGWSLSAAASDFVDLLGDITIENDEFVRSVELREAQRTRINPDDTIWVTIRRGFGLSDLPEAVVDKELERYTKALPYTEQMAFRARMYLYFIVSETQKRAMPTELALLPFVESAFQPEALSRSKAAGLWQFLPSTGDIFDLRQSSWRDDRLDVVESTRAALDYLQYLHNQFEDWHLALAAYNCGEGYIRRAVAANKAKGKPTDFMSLPLPAETSRYVPKLLAIKKLIQEPERYGLKLPAIANEPYFVRVNKNRDLDLETAAQLAETDLQEFRLLNPSFNRPVVVAAHQGSILIPAAKADAFVSNLINWQATGKPLSNWSTHTVKKGETLKTILKMKCAQPIRSQKIVVFRSAAPFLLKMLMPVRTFRSQKPTPPCALFHCPPLDALRIEYEAEIPYRALPRALVLRLRTFANKTDSKATQSRWAKDCA